MRHFRYAPEIIGISAAVVGTVAYFPTLHMLWPLAAGFWTINSLLARILLTRYERMFCGR